MSTEGPDLWGWLASMRARDLGCEMGGTQTAWGAEGCLVGGFGVVHPELDVPSGPGAGGQSPYAVMAGQEAVQPPSQGTDSEEETQPPVSSAITGLGRPCSILAT